MRLTDEQPERFDDEDYLFLPGVFTPAAAALSKREALADDCVAEPIAGGAAAGE